MDVKSEEQSLSNLKIINKIIVNTRLPVPVQRTHNSRKENQTIFFL